MVASNSERKLALVVAFVFIAFASVFALLLYHGSRPDSKSRAYRSLEERIALCTSATNSLVWRKSALPNSGYLLGLVHEAQYRRATGQERPWGYYQTIPQQPIYR
jgi:hypothetical protein